MQSWPRRSEPRGSRPLPAASPGGGLTPAQGAGSQSARRGPPRLPGRRPVAHGHLRRHRRPQRAQAPARHLQPGQAAPAARRVRRRRRRDRRPHRRRVPQARGRRHHEVLSHAAGRPTGPADIPAGRVLRQGRLQQARRLQGAAAKGGRARPRPARRRQPGLLLRHATPDLRDDHRAAEGCRRDQVQGSIGSWSKSRSARTSSRRAS